MIQGMARRWFLVAFWVLGLGMGWIACAQEERATISQQDLLQRVEAKSDVVILDVRTGKEYREGHIPWAINIPHTELPERIAEVRPYDNREVVVYCERGVRSLEAEKTLIRAGFLNVLHLEGDMSAWRDKALPIEKPSNGP